MEVNSTTKTLIRLERLLLVIGVALLSAYVVARVHQTTAARAEIQSFLQAEAEGKPEAESTQANGSEPDFHLWSPQRIAAYKASLSRGVPMPIAILRIRSVNLETPVLEGTDDATLNEGVGHIGGTGSPGGNGNMGIAGHRDGFFRGLKDIKEGDRIEVVTHERTESYVVDEMLIVSPDNVSVLEDRGEPSLTLVTCYPFYFVGSAPQRFIVHATLINPKNREGFVAQSSSVEKGGSRKN